MNKSVIAKVVAMMNQMMGVEKPVKRQKIKKLVYDEPAPQKKSDHSIPEKKGSVRHGNPANERKRLLERKSKKRRKMAAASQRMNRLRGVGI